MKTKKHTKRIISILLALVMVFSLSSMAMAAPQTLSSSDDTQFTITVNGAANGETYTAYKIFDVTYGDNGNYSYTIDSSSVWYNTVAAATDVFTLTQVNGGTTYIVTVNEGVEDDAIIAVFTDAGVPEGAEAAATITASNDTATLDVTSSGAGYYYVTTSLGSLVFIDTTNPAATIDEKNGIPDIDKWVFNDNDQAWEREDDASNNTDINFMLDVTNINGAVNLVIHDAMDEELSIPDESNFHLNSIILYMSDTDTEGTTLVEGTDYTITIGECTVEGCTLENCAFEIHFLRNFDDVSATGHIVLTYSLHMDSDGDAYTDDEEEFDNYAQVTFGTSSVSRVVEGEVYSFGFETFKYTGSDEALEGVQFELKQSTEEDAASAWFEVETIDGKTIYLFEGWTEPAAKEGVTYTQTLTTAADGMIYVEGLDIGTYYLYETQELDGYNPLTGPVTVTIWAEYNESTGEVTNYGVRYTYNGNESTGVVNIENNTGSILPGTGGIGTTIFYIIGIIIVAGAVVLLVTRRRMNRAA